MSTGNVSPALSELLDRIACETGGNLLDRMAEDAARKVNPMIAAVRRGKMPGAIAIAAANTFAALMFRDLVLHFLERAAADSESPHVLLIQGQSEVV